MKGEMDSASSPIRRGQAKAKTVKGSERVETINKKVALPYLTTPTIDFRLVKNKVVGGGEKAFYPIG